MDWQQIEKDFYNDNWLEEYSSSSKKITDWFKQRIDAEQSKQQNNEAVPYTTDITAEIKPNYGN